MPASREGTALIPHHQCSPDRWWDAAAPSADVQALSFPCCGHKTTVTGHPAKGFCWNLSSILQCGDPPVICKGVLLQMNHDLKAISSSSTHLMTCKKGFSQPDRPISRGWPTGFRGSHAGSQSIGSRWCRKIRIIRALGKPYRRRFWSSSVWGNARAIAAGFRGSHGRRKVLRLLLRHLFHLN